jgi:photosystem II stability/assembly factor-like uncharacterized protein
VGTDNGVFKSEDDGHSWSDWFDKLAGLNHNKINDLALHPENPDILFSATDGGIFQSMDVGESWEAVIINQSFQTIIFSAATPYILYGVGKKESLRSKNKRKDWSSVWADDLPTANIIASLDIDPKFLYSGSPTSLHKAFNNGGNWATDSTFKKAPINAISVNTSNLSKIYVGNEKHLYSSNNSGDSRTNISSFTHKLNGNTGTSIDIKVTEITLLSDKSIYVGITSGLYFAKDAEENWGNIDLSGAVNQLSPDETKWML